MFILPVFCIMVPNTHSRPSLAMRLKNIVLGKAHSPHDPAIFHKLSLIAFFAWVGIGADGLSSASYGPEGAFLALGTHIYLGVFVALMSVVTIFVISASYSQIIELFPGGGGGYLVASKLLSPSFGMVAGCALIIDYVLTIAISIAAGAAAIFSFLPSEYGQFMLLFAVFGALVLIILNLRGIKESVVPIVPIFLTFIVTHLFVIVYTIFRHIGEFGALSSSIATDISKVNGEIGLFAMIVLVLYSYSLGAGTYTGIEAVSNSLPILRKPQAETAKKTMRYMAFSLAFLVIGLMVSYLIFNVKPMEGKTLNAVLFESVVYGMGNYGNILLFLTLFSEAAILFLAAQTGFLDGPRVLANMALDKWLPSRFAALSDRFVIRNGVLIMGGAALATIILTKASVKFLVVLYSINVFICFVLSQLGMVRYWLTLGTKTKKWKRKFFVNAIGLGLAFFILVSIVILKFHDGGWITLLVTGTLILLVVLIKRHYNITSMLVKKLDGIVDKTRSFSFEIIPKLKGYAFDAKEKTAVLLVNGFNGLGIRTLKYVAHTFGDTFKNFIFVQIGAVNAGNFKGVEELEILKSNVHKDVNHYVEIMIVNGYYAEGLTAIGTDVVEEVSKIIPDLIRRFPNAIFFGGQIVFPKDSFFSRLLHNFTVFSIQRKLYNQGILMVLVPVKVH